MGASNVEYKISAVFYQMDKLGNLKELEKEDAINEPTSGVRYIKFSPKKIILGPKEEQIFRFVLDIPKAQTKENFRLHLKFIPISTIETKNQQAEKISFSLDTKLALAINIIYFGNKSNLQTEIVDFEYAKSAKNDNVSFKFNLKNPQDFIVGKLDLVEKNEDNTEQIRKTILGFSSYVKERSIQINLLDSEKCITVQRCLIRFTPNELLGLPSVDSIPKK